MNKEQVRHWFERWGISIDSHFKHKCVDKSWLFINFFKESPNDVDLYYLQTDLMSYPESHLAYPIKNFDWKKNSLMKLLKEYPFYQSLNNFGYCLYGYAGDCMDSAIILNGKYIDLVEQYLRNQNESHLHVCLHVKKRDDFNTEKSNFLREEHHTLGNKLIDLGVFHHKWHKRTAWRLEEVEFDEDNKPFISDANIDFEYQKET